MVMLPAKVHAAQEADGCRALSYSRAGVAIFRTTVGLHAVEKLHGARDGVLIDSQICHVAALEGHELPADYGRIAWLPRLIAPAAAHGILGIHDVIERELSGAHQAPVVRHSVGL